MTEYIDGAVAAFKLELLKEGYNGKTFPTTPFPDKIAEITLPDLSANCSKQEEYEKYKLAWDKYMQERTDL